MARVLRRPGRTRPSRTEARPGRPVGVIVMLVLNVALAGIAVGALRTATADMPAVDPALRITGPDGSWRPAEGFGLYNDGNYLMERTVAFVGASATAGAATNPVLTALTLALGAVKAAPGDAYGWTLVASVAAAAGVDDFARQALAQSRALAPNTVGVVVERLSLLPLQTDLDDAAARAAAVADIEMAREQRPQEFEALLARAPDVAGRVALLLAGAPIAPEPVADTAPEPAPSSAAGPGESAPTDVAVPSETTGVSPGVPGAPPEARSSDGGTRNGVSAEPDAIAPRPDAPPQPSPIAAPGGEGAIDPAGAAAERDLGGPEDRAPPAGPAALDDPLQPDATAAATEGGSLVVTVLPAVEAATAADTPPDEPETASEVAPIADRLPQPAVPDVTTSADPTAQTVPAILSANETAAAGEGGAPPSPVAEPDDRPAARAAPVARDTAAPVPQRKPGPRGLR